MTAIYSNVNQITTAYGSHVSHTCALRSSVLLLSDISVSPLRTSLPIQSQLCLMGFRSGNNIQNSSNILKRDKQNNSHISFNNCLLIRGKNALS